MTRRQQFQLGQRVRITDTHGDDRPTGEGRITDLYRGPLTQEWVYVVNDYGYYADEIDLAETAINV